MSDTNNLFQDLQTGSINRREFICRALASGVSFSSIAAMLQACSSASGAGGSSIKWANWAQPGEIARFQAFTANYNRTHHTNVQYSFIPTADNNYFPKILTELEGNVAPDVFYVGDTDVSKLIADQIVVELTPYLNSTKSLAKPDDYVAGLWGAAKTRSGKIYGIPVDCNPLVLWYNESVLEKAGISTMPTDLYQQGQWTRDAFQNMLEKIHASGKYGYILDDGSNYYWSWCTANGGTVYDDNGYGNFITHENPQSLDAMNWLANCIRSKFIIFGANLPKGQGDDLAFIANQVGFLLVGRWLLPEFKATQGLRYDIVPLPSSTSKIASTCVALAYIVMNKQTKNPDQAFDFLTNYVSVQGETFRLQGGGNAVPSIKGPDQVVTAGNDPPHAQYLIDARNVGYALFPAEMGTPGLSDDIKSALEPMWLQGLDIKTSLASVASMADPRIRAAMAKLQ